MQLQGYNQIKRLKTDALEQLLATGDSQERAWAAWELGLRLGTDALPELSQQAKEAPDPGTRRHIAVVLAGLGHKLALETIALNDPDEYVRATAAQYILKTAKASDFKQIQLLINILTNEKSNIVIQSVLNNWIFDDVKIPSDLLFGCIKIESEDVQIAALNQLVAQYDAKDVLKEKVIECFSSLTTKEPIYLFSRWLLNSGYAELIISSADTAARPENLIILDFLVDNEVKFQWKYLITLSKINDPDIDIRLVEMVIVEENIDLLLWLSRGIARAINLRPAKYYNDFLEQRNTSDFRHPALDIFLTLIKKMPCPLMTSADHNNIMDIIDYLENDLIDFLHYHYECEPEFDDFAPEEHIEELKETPKLIKNWLNRTQN